MCPKVFPGVSVFTMNSIAFAEQLQCVYIHERVSMQQTLCVSSVSLFLIEHILLTRKGLSGSALLLLFKQSLYQ